MAVVLRRPFFSAVLSQVGKKDTTLMAESWQSDSSVSNVSSKYVFTGTELRRGKE